MAEPGITVIDVSHVMEDGLVTIGTTVEITPEAFNDHRGDMERLSDALVKKLFPNGKIESRAFRAPRRFINSALIIMKVRIE